MELGQQVVGSITADAASFLTRKAQRTVQSATAKRNHVRFVFSDYPMDLMVDLIQVSGSKPAPSVHPQILKEHRHGRIGVQLDVLEKTLLFERLAFIEPCGIEGALTDPGMRTSQKMTLPQSLKIMTIPIRQPMPTFRSQKRLVPSLVILDPESARLVKAVLSWKLGPKESRTSFGTSG